MAATSPRPQRNPSPSPNPQTRPPRPKPRPPPGEIGSTLTPVETGELLQLHNKARSDVASPPVSWSPELARFAQAWAEEIARTGAFAHRPADGPFAQKYGENIAVGTGEGYKPISGARSWYGEIGVYKPGSPIPKDFASFKSGHYTQMVWKATTEIGAGKAIIQTGPMKGFLVLVCNYNPPGNMIGQAPY